MEESKKKLVFKEESDYTTISYQDNIIKVKKYISFDDMLSILHDYINVYFDTPSGFLLASHNCVGAEYSFLLGVIGKCTDIELSKDNQMSLTIDDLLTHSDLVEEIKDKITNYTDVYSMARMLIVDIEKQKELDKSVGSVIDEAVKKLTVFLTNFKLKDTDISELRDMVKEINSSEFVEKLNRVQSLSEVKKE